jgi:hypothetical protein
MRKPQNQKLLPDFVAIIILKLVIQKFQMVIRHNFRR